MKILSVLAVLAVFYRHSEGLKCQTIADFSSGDVGALALTEEDCTEEGVTTCVRPKLASSAYLTDGTKWGCGECTTAGNCISCASENCNVEPSFTCFTSVSAEAEAKDICDDGITYCKRPKIKVDGSYNLGDWGCGTCSDADTCVQCSTSDCNVAPDQTYTCLKYERSDDIWGKVTTDGNEHVTCYTEAGSGCNMPSPNNPATEWMSCGNGCKDEGNAACRTCDDANCNDQDGVKSCYTGTSADESLPISFCESDESKCQRPAFSYGDVVNDEVEYKCGDCTGITDGSCVSCEEDKCNTKPAVTNTHKCFAWTWSTKWTVGDLKDCQAGDAEQKCSMPKKAEAEHTAEDLALEGCGPCADGKTEECTTTSAQQNKDGTHKCYTWTWSDDAKWGYSDTPINCYDGNDADSKKCSLPKDRSEKTGFSDDGVCAPCDASDTNCLTSEPEKNSGRRVLFSLIALALPIFYTLL